RRRDARRRRVRRRRPTVRGSRGHGIVRADVRARGVAGTRAGGRPASLKGKQPMKPMKPMKKKEYEEALEPLELELNDLAHWLAHTGKRMMVLLEGRDTAGKGGVINTIAERLNPRQVRIVALPKPG